MKTLSVSILVVAAAVTGYIVRDKLAGVEVGLYIPFATKHQGVSFSSSLGCESKGAAVIFDVRPGHIGSRTYMGDNLGTNGLSTGCKVLSSRSIYPKS